MGFRTEQLTGNMSTATPPAKKTATKEQLGKAVRFKLQHFHKYREGKICAVDTEGNVKIEYTYLWMQWSTWEIECWTVIEHTL